MREILYLMSDTEILGKPSVLSLFYYKVEVPISVSQYIGQKMYLVLSVTSAVSWLKLCICLGATNAMIFWLKTT
jgi:hypothetical protein